MIYAIYEQNGIESFIHVDPHEVVVVSRQKWPIHNLGRRLEVCMCVVPFRFLLIPQ